MKMDGIVSTSRPVKVSLGTEMRRLNISPNETFQQFAQQVVQLFQLPHSDVVFQYHDEEGDLITMSSDSELKMALDIAGSNVLKVIMNVKQPQPSAPSLIAPPVMSAPTVPQQTETSVSGGHPRWGQRRFHHDFPQTGEDWKGKWKAKKIEKMNEKAEKGKGKMLARFVSHVTFEDDTLVAPGTSIIKTWRFRNETSYSWPANCFLICVGKQADQMGPDRVPVPNSAAPGQEIDVSIPLTAPQRPGRYVGFYRLSGGNPPTKFGQRVRVQIQVQASGSSVGANDALGYFDSSSSSEDSDDERKVEKILSKNESFRPLMGQLEKMGFAKRKLNAKLLRRFSGDIDQVVVVLLRKQQKKYNKGKFAQQGSNQMMD